MSTVRLDKYLANTNPDISRSYLTKLIKDGKVLVNKKVVNKPSQTINEDDKVKLDYIKKTDSHFKELDLPIIYEDDDCVVISKPVGILSHAKGEVSEEATVASWLNSRVKGLKGNRAGIVHRLDRATSGVMICAKTPEAMLWLQKQFSQRRTIKTYVAILKGEVDKPKFTIDLPIERNPKKPQVFRVGVNGKEAITEVEVMSSNDNRTKVKLMPKTGRTHQLRVHMAYINHPIVGDELYGGEPAPRLYLHAYSLQITLPSKERQTFVAEVPKDFKL